MKRRLWYIPCSMAVVMAFVGLYRYSAGVLMDVGSLVTERLLVPDGDIAISLSCARRAFQRLFPDGLEYKGRGPFQRHWGLDHAYVIHWTHYAKRVRPMLEQLYHFGFQGATFVTGFDLEAMTQEEKACLDSSNESKYWTSVNSKHFLAYYDIVKHQHARALVFEDDASVSFHGENVGSSMTASDFVESIEPYLAEVPEDYDLIFIGGCVDDFTSGDRVSEHVFKSVLSRCASSYIITLGASQKLLATTLPFHWPIDWHLNEVQASLNLTFYQLVPQMMGQTNLGGTAGEVFD